LFQQKNIAHIVKDALMTAKAITSLNTIIHFFTNFHC